MLKSNYMKTLLKIYIISTFILHFINNVYAQNKIAHYTETDIFSAYGNPITIGIFEIGDSNALSNELWDSLKTQDGWRDRFVFYPLETLEAIKDIYEIESLDYRDAEILNKLKEELGLNLILVGGKINNVKVLIYLVDTDGGATVFNNIYENSKNSTIIRDIIKLFNDQKSTSYKLEIQNLPDLIFVEKGKVEFKSLRYKVDTLLVQDDFYISKYECTLKQFNEFVQNTGYKTDAESIGGAIIFKPNGDARRDSLINWCYDENGEIRQGYDSLNYPVIYVSWNDAMQYCNWLSEETGETYRLPKIEEWKFASFGGIYTQKYSYSGSNNPNEVGWYRDNSNDKLHLVGTKKPNEIGLYDMSGNICEWCSDHSYDNTNLIKYINGSWIDTQGLSNIALRKTRTLGSNDKSNYIGFRVVKEIKQSN